MENHKKFKYKDEKLIAHEQSIFIKGKRWWTGCESKLGG